MGPKLVPKLFLNWSHFWNRVFSSVLALEAVLGRLKTTCSANLRKNGGPIWGPFLLKTAKNEAGLIESFRSGAGLPSKLLLGVPPPAPKPEGEGGDPRF